MTLPLVTAEEMRLLDRTAMARGIASGEQMMERAGAGAVEVMERRYGPTLGLRVLVLCGTGNNGGDGLVAARHLRARGAEVHLGLLGDPARMRGEALVHLERLTATGFTVASITHATPLGLSCSIRKPATCWVSRSCTCSRCAYMSTMRGIFDRPMTRPRGR